MFRHGASVAEVAAEIGRAESTTLEYLADFVTSERPESIGPWVAPDEEARIADALRAVPDGRLRPAFEALGGTVPYDRIRIVAARLGRPTAAPPG
jgi:hypothetical protein